MIRTLLPRLRCVSILLIPLTLCFTYFSTGVAQVKTSAAVTVENADWDIVDDKVIITYDLNASTAGEYLVAVTLLKENDKSFRVSPTTVTGDVGVVAGPAKGKAIEWEYKKDFPNGFEGEGYYFGFNVSTAAEGAPVSEQEGGGSKVFLGVLFLAAIVAVAVVLVAGGTKEE